MSNNDEEQVHEEQSENEDIDDDVSQAEEAEGGDGLADMMSKILNQQVRSGPVLAKRKTAMMKEIEETKRESKKGKKTSEEKSREGSKQMVDLSDGNPVSIEFERQLKKLATRGG